MDRETLRKIRRIQIRTKVILESGIGGAYHAVFKGRGMEFAEVREYAPGDEVRTIDWNVTARMGAPYVKKFVEERDLTLLLVVDVSGSQQFGSQYLLKKDYAAELAAVLAFSAVANHDRVGAVLFSDRIEGYVPPGRGRDHALRIVRDLLAREPVGRGTDLAGALRFAQRVMRRRGIVALVSDFQAEGYEKALGALRRRHDVVALHISDPRETDVPAAGLVAFRDPETGERVVADTARPEVRRAAPRPRLRGLARRLQEDAGGRARPRHRRVVRAAALRLLQGPREEAVGCPGSPSLLLAAATTAATSPVATPPPSPVSVKATASRTEVTVGEAFTDGAEGHRPGGGTRFTFPGEAATDGFELRTPPPDPSAAAPLPSPAATATRRPSLPSARRRSRRSPSATACPTAPRARHPPRRSRSRSSRCCRRTPSSRSWPTSGDRSRSGSAAPSGSRSSRVSSLAAALVLWLVRRRRRAGAPRAVPIPELPADAEALRALDSLLASGILSRGEYRPFYIQLAVVAKRYLERRLGAPILEMTTAETLAFLRGHPHGGELLPVVRDLAEAADRIKFAKGQGLAQEAERHLAAVRALVPALEAKLRPAATTATEGRAA